MSSKGWNYRFVVEVLDRSDVGRGPVPLHSVKEVYYSPSGDPASWAEDHNPMADWPTLEDLENTVDLISEAKQTPLLYLQDGRLVEASEYTGLLSLQDRLRGCLLGCAIGDAFGVPFEKRSQDTIKENLSLSSEGFSKVPWEWSESQKWRDRSGQYSDDAQLTRLIYQNVSENEGQFDPEQFAQQLVDLKNSKNPVGFGKGTLAAIERLEEGVDWKEAGNPSPSSGNGSAMRAACFGLFFEDLEDVMTATIESSLPTHRSSEAVAGALVVAVFNYYLKTADYDFWAPDLVRKTAEALDETYPHFSEDLREMAKNLEGSKTFKGHLDWVLSTQPPNSEWPGVSPYVRPTVLWAMVAFLLQPYSFSGCLSNSLSCGGDVDTTAAIAMSFYGTHNGMSAFPDFLWKEVNDRGEWKGPQLLELADEVAKFVK